MTDVAPAPHTHRVTLLIAIVGIAVGGYALWRGDNTRDREDATRDRVQQLETANAALSAVITASSQQETKARAELQKQWQQLATLPQQVRDLTASHEDLRARAERPQRAWSRAEAIYLIELAQRRLSFDRDTATAIVALESADARLASLRDASLQPARERIAKDLQTLRALPDPDRNGLIARLSAIESQVDALPLKGILVGQRSVANQDDAPSLLKRAWRAVANTFEQMISVRKVRASHGEIVTLEEQTLRRQHLSLLAFSAKQAVMRNDQTAFKSALTEMQSWLAHYFGESLAVDAASQELATMMAIDIAPLLPDISAAAQLLTRSASAP